MTEAYSQVAWDQLDLIEATDSAQYEDVMDLVEAIIESPGACRSTADALTTQHGVRFKNFVPGRYPLAVFWSESPSDGPRIEAVFPHPANRR